METRFFLVKKSQNGSSGILVLVGKEKAVRLVAAQAGVISTPLRRIKNECLRQSRLPRNVHPPTCTALPRRPLLLWLGLGRTGVLLWFYMTEEVCSNPNFPVIFRVHCTEHRIEQDMFIVS